MVEDLKNHESGQADESPMATLADEKSFEEHIADINKEKNSESEQYLVDTAIESIADKLSLNKDELGKALLGDGSQDIIGKAQELIGGDENAFMLDTLSDMHDKWCSENSDEFFNRKQFNNRYKFLNFGLIGINSADKYFNLAKPIFEKLGIEDVEDTYDLEEAYDDKYWDTERDDYFTEEVEEEHTHNYREGDDVFEDEELKRWRVEDPDGYEKNVRKYDHLKEEDALERYQREEGMTDVPFEYDDRPLYVITEPITYELGHGCYFAENLYKNPSEYLSKGSSEKIVEAIKNSFNTAAEITMQVGEYGSGDEEADWGCLWAYHQRGGEGVYDYWYQNYDPFAENDTYFNSQEYINDGWD